VIALFAAVTMVLSACSDDSNPNQLAESVGTLNISTATMSFGVSGGEASFTVTGGTAFVRSESDWLSVERASGDAKSSSFTVTCEENTDTARTGSILANLNGAFTRIAVSQSGKSVDPDVNYSFRTANEIAQDMYPGWNLGNTLEATGGETSWQSTKTTQAIIDYVKAQGFKSVRIPCAWDIHSTNGTIDADWLARVKEIVDYCVNDGLYVVLNDHWDNGWIEELGFSASSDSYKKVDDATISTKTTRLKDIWTQLANAFSSYDEHLIFAGMNEPFQNYNLFNSVSTSVLTPILNTYNQAFVDAVRATGGNNAQRTLVFQGSGANIDKACESIFAIPTDLNSQKGYLMAEVHFYDPYDFALNESGKFYYWGSANHVSGSSYNATYGEESYVKEQMAKLKTKFFSNGVPVILGEFGANWRDLSSVSDADQSKHDASVKTWFNTVVSEAINNGVVPMVWDINVANQSGTKGVMTIINRANLSIFCTSALEGIQEGAAAGSWPK